MVPTLVENSKFFCVLVGRDGFRSDNIHILQQGGIYTSLTKQIHVVLYPYQNLGLVELL